MAKLAATPAIIVVDRDAGQTSGPTTIKYEKERDEELWERTPGSTWARINVHLVTGLGDEADRSGSYIRVLKPGQSYEAGVFRDGHGPLSTDPIRLASLAVFCLLKKPRDRALITDQNRASGGTWHWHQVHTKVPTSIVSIAVSRTPPKLDADGIPHPVSPDGAPTAPLTLTTDHKVEIKPILPGNRYFFSVVVVDSVGNWDVRQEQFTALRRVVSVEFPKVYVFNDGDPFGHGEGEFWFRVYSGPQNQPVVIQDFHRPTQDIDDWGETDRPYAMGFAHVGTPQVVKPGETEISVSSWGVEHDGFLEADEGASSRDAVLPFPSGMSGENVAPTTFTMDCPVSTAGDDFHYGVDVRWSVNYVP